MENEQLMRVTLIISIYRMSALILQQKETKKKHKNTGFLPGKGALKNEGCWQKTESCMGKAR